MGQLAAGRTHAFGMVLTAAFSGTAFADDSLLERALSATATAPPAAAIGDLPPSVGAPGTIDLPRLTRSDLPAVTDREPPGQRSEFSELGYRWSVSRGRVDLGLGLGAVVRVARPAQILPGTMPIDLASASLASGTVLTLGMRYRASERSVLFADAVNVHGFRREGGDVIGKVGVEFKSAQSRWNVAYGGLGMRLAGDTKMTLRVRRNGFAVSMRRAF